MIEPSVKVRMLCQFGSPPRGLSPYGDSLLRALQRRSELTVEPADYAAPFPSALHPAQLPPVSEARGVHWRKPSTWQAIARSGVDVVHIQHWLAPMAVYLASIASLAKEGGARVVVTVHNAAPHESMPWAAGLESRLLSSADLLLVHDRRSRNLLVERLGRRCPDVAIVPHGIECISSVQPASPRDYELLGLDPTRRYACIFGNLRGYKGLDVLLQAWAAVAEQNQTVDLIIAGRFWSGDKGLGARVTASLLGSARQAARLRAMLASPRLRARVHLLEGFIPDENVDALLRVASLAVFPYIKFSSQSGAACRAAGAGCPLIVSDVGGLPDLAIDTNRVVPPGDAKALGKALRSQLSTANVDRERQLLHARQFDWSHVADVHADLYRDQAERRKRKH